MEVERSRVERDAKVPEQLFVPFRGCVSRRAADFPPPQRSRRSHVFTLICCSECLSGSELSVKYSPRCTARNWLSCGADLSFRGPRGAAASAHQVLGSSTHPDGACANVCALWTSFENNICILAVQLLLRDDGDSAGLGQYPEGQDPHG